MLKSIPSERPLRFAVKVPSSIAHAECTTAARIKARGSNFMGRSKCGDKIPSTRFMLPANQLAGLADDFVLEAGRPLADTAVNVFRGVAFVAAFLEHAFVG